MMSTPKTNPEQSFNPVLPERTEAEPGELPRLVVVMLGYPGSGKTSFGRQLAIKINGCCIDGDAIMAAVKTGLKKPATDEAIRDLWQTQREELQRSAINSGQSIIRANQHNNLDRRRQLADWAKSLGYQFLIAWLKTPREVAIERLIERGGSGPGFSPSDQAQASKRIDWILTNFDPPAEDEPWVEIDGQANFENQYQTFENSWRQLSDPAAA